jgi:putative membrane protein
MAQAPEPPEGEIKHALGILALVRTAFSSERSALSWVRTSASLYAFGFSIVKFVGYLEGQEAGRQFPSGARILGLAMIIIALAFLGVALFHHRRQLGTIQAKGMPVLLRWSLPTCAIIALFTVGLVALIGIFIT